MKNKSSFFMIRLDITTKRNNSFYLEKLENNCDLILHGMNVKNNLYRFNGKGEIIYLFKSENRKRKGQLIKLCNKYLDEKQEFEATALKNLTMKI